jgi:hypothetical protein
MSRDSSLKETQLIWFSLSMIYEKINKSLVIKKLFDLIWIFRLIRMCFNIRNELLKVYEIFFIYMF